MSADLLARLIAAGTPAELVAEVAMTLAEAKADASALERRRAADRARQASRRAASADVTGRHVTARDTADSDGEKESPPNPHKKIYPPERANALSAPKGAKRGSRIDPDWQPPAIADLPDLSRAMAEQWPSGAYETEAACFVAYWLAESGVRAAKRDWGRAWVNRVGQVHHAMMRAKRSGVTYQASPKASGPRDWRRDAELLEERADSWDRFGKPDEATDLRRQAAAIRARGAAAAIAGRPPPLQVAGARRT